ncbi:MAG: chromosomal replication initiator protein DnaA, partial [Oscillospiraceae bacterium]|nr:chromosomal replication initiator protein DnaA [Oscillospiraceae bacterium]
NKILDKVSTKYGITEDDLKGKKRNKEIVNPRHIAVFITRKLTDLSLPAIAKIFDRDHTTVMASLKNIEDELKVNSLLEIEINELIKEIKE